MNLVLIPPLGHDQYFYEPLAAELSEINLIRLEYPYFEEDFPWESRDLIEELAQYFAGKLTHLSDFTILGVSLGATLSLRIKEILGPTSIHLFMVSSGGQKVQNFRKEMILTHLRQMGPVEFLLNALEVGSHKSFEESDFKNHFHHDLAHPAAYWQHYSEVLWQPEARALAGARLVALIKASVEVNFEQLLTRYQQEITMVWGGKDKVFSLRFFSKFQKLCPKAQFHLYPDLGHFSPLETPALFKDMLLSHEKKHAIPHSHF